MRIDEENAATALRYVEFSEEKFFNRLTALRQIVVQAFQARTASMWSRSGCYVNDLLDSFCCISRQRLSLYDRSGHGQKLCCCANRGGGIFVRLIKLLHHRVLMASQPR